MALYRSPEYQTSDPWGGGSFYPRAVMWTSQLDTSNEFSSQLTFGLRRDSKTIFKIATVSAILDFKSERF